MIGLIVLLILMIVAAIAAVEMKDLLSSVVAVGAVGLGLSVAFLLLQAPDLAITQLVVEILCLIILIRATVTREEAPLPSRTRWAVGIITVLFLAAFLVFAVPALRGLPPFGAAPMKVSQEYVNRASRETGSPNVVTAIILDFRGYDTLGETTVLFTAVLGAIAVLRRVGRRKSAEK